jgi:hypothetical protein
MKDRVDKSMGIVTRIAEALARISQLRGQSLSFFLDWRSFFSSFFLKGRVSFEKMDVADSEGIDTTLSFGRLSVAANTTSLSIPVPFFRPSSPSITEPQCRMSLSFPTFLRTYKCPKILRAFR